MNIISTLEIFFQCYKSMTILILVTNIVFELLSLSQPSISLSQENAQCPVDGAWTLWTVWSGCEGECGGVGHQLRTRNCSMPHNTDQREIRPCAVPGCSYEQYEKLLSQNSVRLEQLKMLKQLSSSKTALLTKCVSSNCEFKTVLDELEKSAIKFWNALQCVKKDIGCPVAGGWSEWSAWSRCSARCGEGSRIRCRVCCNPPPTSAEHSCPGDNCQHSPCTASECGQTRRDESLWSPWSQWSPCSASCGFGIKRRSRVCSKETQKLSKTSNIVEENPYESSLDDSDYYNDYLYDDKSDQYKADIQEEEDSVLRKERRSKRSCHSNVEYYSTIENYDDYTDPIETTSKSDKQTRTYSSSFNTEGSLSETQKKTYASGNFDEVLHSFDESTKVSANPEINATGKKSCSSKVEYFSTDIDEDEDYMTTVAKTSKMGKQQTISTKDQSNFQTDSKSEHTSTESLEMLKPVSSKTLNPEITTKSKIQGSCKTKVEYYSTEVNEDYSSLIETTSNLPHKSAIIISTSKKQIQTTLYTTQSVSIATVPLTMVQIPSSHTSLKLTSPTATSVEDKDHKHKRKTSSRVKSTTSLPIEDYTDIEQIKTEELRGKISAGKHSLQEKIKHSTAPIICKSQTTKDNKKQKWIAENILPYQEGFHKVIDDDPVSSTTSGDCKDKLFDYPSNYLNDDLSTNLTEKVEEYVDRETAQGQKEGKINETKWASTASTECVECVTIKPSEEDQKYIESTSIKTTKQFSELSENTEEMKTTLVSEETISTSKNNVSVTKITVTNKDILLSTSSKKVCSKQPTLTPNKSTTMLDKSTSTPQQSTLASKPSTLIPKETTSTQKQPSSEMTVTTMMKTTDTNDTLSISSTTECGFGSECVTIKPEGDATYSETLGTSVSPKTTSSLSIPPPSSTNSSQAVSSTTLLTPLSDINIDNITTTSNLNKTTNPFSSSTFPKQIENTTVDQPTTSRAVTLPTLEEDGRIENLTEEESSFVNCDLIKILQLPNYNDSFKAEGCKGPFEEIKPCDSNPCKVRGGWSSWSAWSACIPECGTGKQMSTRSCTNPDPGDKGSPCSGETSRKRSCFLRPCSVKVSSSRALLMSGDSVIKYQPLQQHYNMLMLYVRFRHYNCSGELITRKTDECQTCDIVSISLSNCYVLVSIRQESCYTYFSTVYSLSVGDWHEILMTIEGSVVSLRLDDSPQIQKVRLSCRPKAPNYDSAMKIGGRFIGEVDHLSVNFKKYALQKKHAKRNTQSESDMAVEPSESSQVQAKLNSEEMPTVSLAHFIQAPCFSNSSTWQLKLAVKPEFSIGLVMLMRGYDESELMVLTLEGEEVRLRVKMGARLGECEHAVSVAPRTWLHITLTKPASAPLGLAVNNNERCVVQLDTEDSDGKDVLQCREILLGEVPLFVKMLMDTDSTHSVPVKSPLGELGSLMVDNHTLDLSRLPRKVPPDLTDTYPQKMYRLSSYSASSTIYFQEVLVLMKEPLSLLCVYDLSAEEPRPKKGSKKGLETEYAVSWLKLDIPVETYFNESSSSTKYQITDDGKTSTLNITDYTDAESVEGFYCCWLQYPLPQQPGFNIVTYQVVIITTDQDRPVWLIFKNNANLVFFVIILSICVIWMVCEVIIDKKKGSGFIRCRKPDEDEEHKNIHYLMFSEKGIKRLGRTSAAHRAYDRYLAHVKTQANQVEAKPLVLNGVENTDTSGAESNAEYEAADHEVKIEIPHNRRFKRQNEVDKTTVVGYSLQNPTPKFPKHTATNSSVNNLISVEDLQIESDSDECSSSYLTSKRRMHAGGENPQSPEIVDFQGKPDVGKIGMIQNTQAYKNIKTDLKFLPQKYKKLEKYWTSNK